MTIQSVWPFKWKLLSSVTIQMKAIEQYLHVVLFIVLYKVVLTSKSANETFVCGHSNESYWAVLSFKGLGNLNYGPVREKGLSQSILTVTFSRWFDLYHHALLASWSLHHTLIAIRLSVSSTDRAIVSSANLWAGTHSLSWVRNTTDGVRICARVQLTGIQGWEVKACEN